MKKYYIAWKPIVIVIGISLLILFVSDYMQIQEGIHSEDTFWGGVLITFIPIAFGVLLATRYSYAAIDGMTLKFVYLLFYRRTIDIRSITEINDQSTYKVGKSIFRSLYIFYKDKNNLVKWIELRITIFPEKTLGKLIKNLKEINPGIELNKYSEKLMRSAS
ncbi:MAG TPA: hypothetical protein VJI96_03520 [Candidatus Andersenbacteria bacterium]|nr:hypothetical protein [Candidatus Andersenbacteria bacterium]